MESVHRARADAHRGALGSAVMSDDEKEARLTSVRELALDAIGHDPFVRIDVRPCLFGTELTEVRMTLGGGTRVQLSAAYNEKQIATIVRMAYVRSEERRVGNEGRAR